ncbi:DUF6188 family protein [Williamsia maris]|uniref:Uncharacterized protein n=1 Tax=Williamsia maris TaxID=72806 RepID=A0ABT1HJ97_9NOCA|nr:DUF6188 family protein [Williamsia maris]MCP2178009.1 hypothetical protein [Williamsia maris]
MTTAIAIIGSVVTDVSDGFSVRISTSDGHTVTIENNFEVKGGTNPFSVAASASGEFSLESSIFKGAKITDAQYDESGSLSISLDNGSEISVAPDEVYESWQVAGPSGSLIVCMPSGDIAIWS